jgi:hypothetical protein
MTRLISRQRMGHHKVTFVPGARRRPDLFGLGSRGWVVAEAKERSNAMESALVSTLTE